MSVLILTPDPEKPGGIANYFKVLRNRFNVPVHYFLRGPRAPERRGGRIGRLLRDYLAFSRECRSHRLVQVNSSLRRRSTPRDALFLVIARLLGKKSVLFFRGWDKNYESMLIRNVLLFWLFRQIYFRAAAMITLSEDVRRTLVAWGYTGRIYLETTLVDDDLTLGVDERMLKKKRKSLKKRPRLLFLSRVEKEKGIYEVIAAYEKLKKKYKNLRLDIAGEGTELENVKTIVEQSGIRDIRFLGFVRDEQKADVLRKANVFVFPTYHGEGMPHSVLEAMAFGLPVITRRVGGLCDFFQNNRMGILVESTDLDEIAEAIEQMLLDRKITRKMALYNYRYAREHFMASIVVDRIEKIYKDLLDEPMPEVKEK